MELSSDEVSSFFTAICLPLFRTAKYTLPYDPSPTKDFEPKLSVVSFNSSKDSAGTSIGGGAFAVSLLGAAEYFEPLCGPGAIEGKKELR